jgi:hypothetical protein
MHGRSPLRYATNYILQMIIAACFTLLKHLSSFFAVQVDFDEGRQLFHRTIAAIRSMSVINNDLPWRLAELMVQMYNGSRLEARNLLAQQQQMGNNGNGADPQPIIDDSLQLKVRCRMSMSLVFDSIWRWREEYQAHGRGNLEGQREQLEKLLISFPPEGFDSVNMFWSPALFLILFGPELIDEAVFYREITRLRDDEEVSGFSSWQLHANATDNSPSSMMGKLGLSSSKKVKSRRHKTPRSEYTAVGGVASRYQTNVSSKGKDKSTDWMMNLPPPSLNYDGCSSPKGRGESPVRLMNYSPPAFNTRQRGSSSKRKSDRLDRVATGTSSEMFLDGRTMVLYNGRGKLPDITATQSAFSIASQDDMEVFSGHYTSNTTFFTSPESSFGDDDCYSAAFTPPEEQDVHSPLANASDSTFNLPASPRSHSTTDHLRYKIKKLSSFSNNTMSSNSRKNYYSNASNTAAMKNPTNPESAAESSASSTHHMDATLMPPSQHQLSNQLLAAQSGGPGSITPSNGVGLPSAGMLGYGESNYEVFDPLNWMLDGLVDFPYSYAAVQGLEANGLS